MAGFLSTFLRGVGLRNGTGTRARPQERIGGSGLPVFGGIVSTPEKNDKLVGPERYKTFGELLANVAIVGAGARYFLNLVAKAGWAVEPSDGDDREAVEIAERMEDALFKGAVPWRRVVRKAASHVLYDFAVLEWIAGRMPEGFLGLTAIESRPQSSIAFWDVDRAGNLQGVIQQHPQTYEYVYLPRTKIVYLYDDGLTDSIQGMGMLRQVAESASQLRRYEQLEGYGFETDLRGIPIGRLPKTLIAKSVKDGKLSDAEAQALSKPLEKFIANHVKNPALGLLLDSQPYQSQDAQAQPSNVRRKRG